MNRTFVFIASLVLCCLVTAQSEQFTFIDDQITWTKSGYDYPPMLGPKNWVTPIDYVNGKVYAKYEVIKKPSNKNVGVQLCMWQDGYKLESCSGIKSYTSAGTYYYDWGTPAGWWKLKALDYTRAFQCAYVMHKDGGLLLMTGSCGTHCYGGTDVDKHVPIVFHLTVVVVSKGSTFTPPGNWGGCPWAGCGKGSSSIQEITYQNSNSQDIPVHFSGGEWWNSETSERLNVRAMTATGRMLSGNAAGTELPGFKLLQIKDGKNKLNHVVIAK